MGRMSSNPMAEKGAFYIFHILQGDLCAVCQQHPFLQQMKLFQVSGFCDIPAAGLFLIGNKVGNGESGELIQFFQQEPLFPVLPLSLLLLQSVWKSWLYPLYAF